MPIKKGTVIHKYTEQDYINIGKGIYLPGVNKRSQQYAYERYLHRKSLGLKKNKQMKREEYNLPLFTAYEDLCVIDDEFPSTHTIEECKKRKEYLEKNFIEVGWGSLIGTQIIHW